MPKAGVVDMLIGNVVPAGGLRGHLQHEVRRLAPLLDGVAALVDHAGTVHAKGHQQVGDPQALALGDVPAHRDLTQDDGGIRSPEVTAPRRLVALVVEMDGVLRIVSWGKLREPACRPGGGLLWDRSGWS